MAIALSDLILFNNVESTDPIVSNVVKLPFRSKFAYVPGVTVSNGYEEFVRGDARGRGSQILIRALGKGTATSVKANTTGAFKFSHGETADTLITIPLDNVIKQSEEIYEAIEAARISSTGAEKARIVFENILELEQSQLTTELVAGANTADDDTAITALNLVEKVTTIMATELDETPTTMVVNGTVYALLLQLQASGQYTSNNAYDTIRTGVLGFFLGMNVVKDDNLTAAEFVLYDHRKFFNFNLFVNFDLHPATDFNGVSARGLMVRGGYAPVIAKDSGAWAVKYILA